MYDTDGLFNPYCKELEKELKKLHAVMLDYDLDSTAMITMHYHPSDEDWQTNIKKEFCGRGKTPSESVKDLRKFLKKELPYLMSMGIFA
jgi:hypothetical protein